MLLVWERQIGEVGPHLVRHKFLLLAQVRFWTFSLFGSHLLSTVTLFFILMASTMSDYVETLHVLYWCLIFCFYLFCVLTWRSNSIAIQCSFRTMPSSLHSASRPNLSLTGAFLPQVGKSHRLIQLNTSSISKQHNSAPLIHTLYPCPWTTHSKMEATQCLAEL